MDPCSEKVPWFSSLPRPPWQNSSEIDELKSSLNSEYSDMFESGMQKLVCRVTPPRRPPSCSAEAKMSPSP